MTRIKPYRSLVQLLRKQMKKLGGEHQDGVYQERWFVGVENVHIRKNQLQYENVLPRTPDCVLITTVVEGTDPSNLSCDVVANV